LHRQFGRLFQEQFEREKEQALEKLRQDHQREIQALEQRYIVWKASRVIYLNGLIKGRGGGGKEEGIECS
jgi:hypothetical protein